MSTKIFCAILSGQASTYLAYSKLIFCTSNTEVIDDENREKYNLYPSHDGKDFRGYIKNITSSYFEGLNCKFH